MPSDCVHRKQASDKPHWATRSKTTTSLLIAAGGGNSLQANTSSTLLMRVLRFHYHMSVNIKTKCCFIPVPRGPVQTYSEKASAPVTNSATGTSSWWIHVITQAALSVLHPLRLLLQITLCSWHHWLQSQSLCPAAVISWLLAGNIHSADFISKQIWMKSMYWKQSTCEWWRNIVLLYDWHCTAVNSPHSISICFLFDLLFLYFIYLYHLNSWGLMSMNVLFCREMKRTE